MIIFPFLSNEPNSYTNIFINWIIPCNLRLNKSIKYSILKQINNPVFIFDFVSKDQKDNDCTKPLPLKNLLGFNQAFGTRNIYLNSLSAIDYSMNILNFFVVFCTTWTGSLSCTWQLGDSCYNLVTDHQSFFAAQAQCQLVYNGNLVRIPKYVFNLSIYLQFRIKSNFLKVRGYEISYGICISGQYNIPRRTGFHPSPNIRILWHPGNMQIWR